MTKYLLVLLLLVPVLFLLYRWMTVSMPQTREDAMKPQLPCEIGARFQSVGDGQAWQPMTSAPRDGTVVELKNSYGVAPSYGLFRWTNEHRVANGADVVVLRDDDFHWEDLKNQGAFFRDDGFLTWRPFAGSIEAYRDPTNGVQDDSAYWRGAVASKYGLRADFFEHDSGQAGRHK